MKLSMRAALRTAIAEEMRADPNVIVLGEDVAAAGGVFKVTAGLLDEFGTDRVRDTPISETAIVGAALGAAATGLRPIAEIMFAEFMGVAFDQIATEAAKLHYLSNGRLKAPLVIRVSGGAGSGFGAQHSLSAEAWLMNTPGLTVVTVSGPQSAYGLMRSAIQNDNPIVVIEPRALYGVREEVDTEASLPKLGHARIARPGADITVVSLGQMVRVALEGAQRLDGRISCEVIDLQTVLPWDSVTVFESVSRTGRLLVVEENPMTGGWGADVASLVAARCFDDLVAPVARVACPDAPVPAGSLEKFYLPSADDVVDAALSVRGEEAPSLRWAGWTPLPAEQGRPADHALARRAALRSPLERYGRMLEIRMFEDAAERAFRDGLVVGPVHTSHGQEAVAVAIAASTRATDTVTCTYRGHGIALALGLEPEQLFREILTRPGGVAGGRGGSMHLSGPEVGMLPTFAIVGAGLPVAVGAALAAQLRGDKDVAVAVFGDGATNTGAFHEALNLASVWRLPVIFVCENNQYGEYSPLRATTPLDDLFTRASAYAMPASMVDGMDLDGASTAVMAAVMRARNGGGPTLLEMKTYRYRGHSAADPGEYRPADELATWQARDPLAIAARGLAANGATAQVLADIRADVHRAVQEALVSARSGPELGPSSLITHIWADDSVAERSVGRSGQKSTQSR